MSIGSWLRQRALGKLFGFRAEPRRLADLRFVALDVDLTGTSIQRDHVTGIAALPLASGTFRILDLRYFALPAESATLARDGVLREDVDVALKDFIAGGPLVTYNVPFVRQMVLRACPAAGLHVRQDDWIDLRSAAVVVAREGDELTSMEHWLKRMSAGGPRLHDATYDVFSIAQMLQVLLAHCEDAGISTLESYVQLQRARAWLRRH